jgi:hypothetical protein
MPELVPSEAGRLIPAAGGVQDVAETLLQISDDHALFSSAAAASESARRQGTWSAVADRVVTAVRQGLDGSSAVEGGGLDGGR